jgi:L-seryl-tRNA(Ser) seleniumtransferase
LLGRKDLIEAARFNTAPHSDSIGRGMKASKEATIGLLVALELYFERDHAADAREWMRRAELIVDAVSGIDGLTAQIHVPPVANHVPHVRLTWERGRLGSTGDDLRASLRAGDPPIEIVPAAPPLDPSREEIQIGVWQLQAGEAEIVARRLREILISASSTAS